jgi:ABC-type transporter Mla MlaB component
LGAPEQPPTASITALRPAHDPNLLLVIVRGVLDRDAAARVGDEFADLVRTSRVDRVVCDLGGVVRADAAAVDAVCRIRLTARRLGCGLRLSSVPADLRELLELMGLCEALDGSSAVDVEGQSEEGEHASRVEEERDPADPPV